MNQAMETRVAALEKLLKDKGVLADDKYTGNKPAKDGPRATERDCARRHGANRSSSAFC
jgi:hypothetical protein